MYAKINCSVMSVTVFFYSVIDRRLSRVLLHQWLIAPVVRVYVTAGWTELEQLSNQCLGIWNARIL